MTEAEIKELAVVMGVMSTSEIDGEIHYTVDTDSQSVVEFALVLIAISKGK